MLLEGLLSILLETDQDEGYLGQHHVGYHAYFLMVRYC
jgi:hypothetical protein